MNSSKFFRTFLVFGIILSILPNVSSQETDFTTGGIQKIMDIVKYASERLNTLVPEIEMPGHAQAAIATYPWLVSTDVPAVYKKKYVLVDIITGKALANTGANEIDMEIKPFEVLVLEGIPEN